MKTQVEIEVRKDGAEFEIKGSYVVDVYVTAIGTMIDFDSALAQWDDGSESSFELSDRQEEKIREIAQNNCERF